MSLHWLRDLPAKGWKVNFLARRKADHIEALHRELRLMDAARARHLRLMKEAEDEAKAFAGRNWTQGEVVGAMAYYMLPQPRMVAPRGLVS